MNKRRDNIQNQKLKELMDKKNDPAGQAMDDFDKEALEGFAMLNHEEEIIDLKEELDEKMIRVFSEEKRPARPLYWLAAAGLLLIIGFSIYFIQTDNAARNSDLSIHAQPPGSGEALQENITREAEKNQDLQFKKPGPAVQDDAGDKEERKESRAAENNRKEPAAPPEKSRNAPVSAANMAQSEALSDESKGAAAESQPVETPAAAIAEKELKKNEAQRELDEETGDKVSLQEVVALSAKEGARSKQKKAQSAKSDRDQAFDGGVKDQDQGVYNVPATAAAPAPEIVVGQAYYAGGETALTAELKTKLKAAGLDQKFDALLFINAEKKVEKVELVQTYDLDKKQQKKVTEVLKALDKFDFTGGLSPGKTLVPYRLAYRP